jgi:hypothetical protein
LKKHLWKGISYWKPPLRITCKRGLISNHETA